MAHWLVKSEPDAFSWEEQVRRGTEPWTGVRNAQAARHLREMRPGDRAFFYHSVDEKRIVGVVEVIRDYYPDHTDPSGRFGMVDVKAIAPLPRPVGLADIKARPELEDMVLVRNSRLSVQPVTDEEWRIVCEMGGMAG